MMSFHLHTYSAIPHCFRHISSQITACSSDGSIFSPHSLPSMGAVHEVSKTRELYFAAALRNRATRASSIKRRCRTAVFDLSQNYCWLRVSHCCSVCFGFVVVLTRALAKEDLHMGRRHDVTVYLFSAREPGTEGLQGRSWRGSSLLSATLGSSKPRTCRPCSQTSPESRSSSSSTSHHRCAVKHNPSIHGPSENLTYLFMRPGPEGFELVTYASWRRRRKAA